MIREGEGRYKRPEKGKEEGVTYPPTPWKYQIENAQWWVISSEVLHPHS